MEHLRNILVGVGEVLSVFGTAPQYKVPKMGDRRVDAQRIGSDWRKVGAYMAKALEREQHGASDNCPTQR